MLRAPSWLLRPAQIFPDQVLEAGLSAGLTVIARFDAQGDTAADAHGRFEQREVALLIDPKGSVTGWMPGVPRIAPGSPGSDEPTQPLKQALFIA